MKTTIALLLAILVTQSVRALSFSFENTSYESTDVTVDWSDGVADRLATQQWLNQNQEENWFMYVDKLAFPTSYLWFRFLPQWYRDLHPEVSGGDPSAMLVFELRWAEPVPTAGVLTEYEIWHPEYISFVSQGATSITFHIDSGMPIAALAAVPDSFPSVVLLAIAGIVLTLARPPMTSSEGSAASIGPKRRPRTEGSASQDCTPPPVPRSM